MRIILVGCSTQKDPNPELMPASSRYTSPLFKKSMAFAKLHSEHVAIVSAKLGLVLTEQLIADYDEKLSARRASEWARGVVAELDGIFGKPTSVLILAGNDYATPLRAALEEKWPEIIVDEPLLGMSIGARLQFFNEHPKVCRHGKQGACAVESPEARRAALRERAKKTITEVKSLVAFDLGTTSPPDWRPFVVELAEIVAELLETSS